MIRISTIRMHYELEIPPGTKDAAERALATYADRCPAYKSIEGCIKVESSAAFAESSA